MWLGLFALNNLIANFMNTILMTRKLWACKVNQIILLWYLECFQIFEYKIKFERNSRVYTPALQQASLYSYLFISSFTFEGFRANYSVPQCVSNI